MGEIRRVKAVNESESAEEGGSDTEEEDTTNLTGTGGDEREEEPLREVVSQAGTEENRARHSSEDSPIISSQDEGSDKDVNMNEKKCNLCEYRADSEAMMNCHLLDRHIPRDEKEKRLRKRTQKKQ